MNKGLNTAVLLAVIAAGLLLFGGILRDIGNDLPVDEGAKVLRKVKDLISDSMSQSVTVTREMEFNGSATHNNSFELKDISPGKVNIQYSPKQANISLDGKDIVVQENKATVGIEEFEGFLSVEDDTVEMNGQAASFNSGNISIQKESLSLSINGTFERADVEEVKVKTLDLEASSGTLDIGDSISLTLDDKATSIHAFYGNLSFEPRTVHLDGEASNIGSGNKTITGN